MRNGRLVRKLLMSVLAFVFPASDLAAFSDDEAVRRLLKDMFERADARFSVDPVVVVNDHAIADWFQDDRGGRALLKRKAGQWTIVLCSGDGIRSADAMRQAGVSPPEAAKLAASLEGAEKSMPSERRALLASFEGTVLMGADGEHPVASHDTGGAHRSHDQSGRGK